MAIRAEQPKRLEEMQEEMFTRGGNAMQCTGGTKRAMAVNAMER